MKLGPERKRQTEIGVQGRFGGQFELFQLSLLQAFGLGPSVLEPDLHLGLCEGERAGEFGSFRNGQVLFLSELSLQGQELRRGERCTGFAVGLVLAERTGTCLASLGESGVHNPCCTVIRLRGLGFDG